MGRFNRPARQRRRGELIRPGNAPPAGRPAICWGLMALISLVLVAVPVMLYNQQQSGNPFKIRRELRKF